MTLQSTILGYPRIGANREFKKALESYWKGAITGAELDERLANLRLENFGRLRDAGLQSIPDSHTYYDQVLDATTLVGALPQRFADLTGLDAYYAAARGTADKPALEMTKWFDTNYHYLVPEIDATTPIHFADDGVVKRYQHARKHGFETRPVIVGPVTLLALSKGSNDDPDFEPLKRLDDVVGVYAEVLVALGTAGAQWVQFDEPALVSDNLSTDRQTLAELAGGVYERLSGVDGRPRILLALPYGDSSTIAGDLATSGVEALGIDLCRGSLPTSGDFTGVTIAAGVVDGRNIWRCDLEAAAAKLDAVSALGANVVASTSNSLQHVPHSLDGEVWEGDLNDYLHSWLAFADEKVGEVITLGRGLSSGWASVADEVDSARAALRARKTAPGVVNDKVRARLEGLGEAERQREEPAVRRTAQHKRLGLPLIPTTTIGSFPQTREIRRARAQFTKGELSAADYQARLREEIASVIRLQEDLDVDVLVHGEAERNDMVQYFAELLDGFDVTSNGWVQSYGSRCTRPSILWGDVARSQSLGGEWTTYAQSLTKRPVKGMLTGPVTIIAWSFPRNDIPLAQVADQIALALRDEIAALEQAGTAIIQVDEPALRELLPLEKSRHAEYLSWAVGAFKLATSGVRADTQIHTHLCYSEFNQIIDALAALDADVTSIEAARSRMELLPSVRDAFVNDLGPGVWDIHSPRVPSTDELYELLKAASRVVPAERLWANPDCGLKTRDYPETKASLANLVAAAKRLRAELA